MFEKQIIKEFITDRHLVAGLFLFILLCIIYCAYTALAVRPTELQVVTHYTSYGTTNFYRDQWQYLIGFVGFGLIVCLAHLALVYKIFTLKGREAAVPFMWLGVVVILFAFAIVRQVLGVATLS